MTSEEKLISLRKRFDYLRAHPDELRTLIKEFSKTFLIDRKRRALILTPFEIDVVVEVLTSKELIILAPRGSGKSWALAVAVVLWLYYYRSGEEVIVIAPLDRQAKKIFGYVTTHFENSRELMTLTKTIRMRNDPALEMIDNSIFLRMPISKGYQGQSIRGSHPTFLIVDESPYIPDHLFIDNVEPVYEAHNAPFVNIGTPLSRDNHTYRYYYDDAYAPDADGKNGFNRKKYTWEYCAEQGDAYESYFRREVVLKKRKRWGADSMRFRREYNCEFIEAEGHFFTTPMVQGTYYDLKRFVTEPNAHEDYYITIDLGRQMNAYVWVLWRKIMVNDVERFEVINIWERIPTDKPLNFVDIRREILHHAKLFGAQSLVIDAQGIGSAQLDDFRNEMEEFGIDAPLIEIKFAGNKKGIYYEQYQTMVRNGQIGIPYPDDMEIEEERLRIQKGVRQHLLLNYSFSKDNQLNISIAKNEHDDIVDACSYVIKLASQDTWESGGIVSVMRKDTLKKRRREDTGLPIRGTGRKGAPPRKKLPSGM